MLSFLIKISVVLQKWLPIYFTGEYVVSTMLKFNVFYVSTPLGKNMVIARNENKKLMPVSLMWCLY